jgi:hypothetical protein
MSGCSNQSNTSVSQLDQQFAKTFPIKDMNKSLGIAEYEQKQYYLSGSEIPLIVENKSSRVVSFDTDQFVLLRNTGSQWVELKNAITYSNKLLLSPHQEATPNILPTHVKPILDDINPANNDALIPVRIVIIGKFMNGNKPSGKKVGAYVDVFLKPESETIMPTEAIQYSTEAVAQPSMGKIKGVITSVDEKPLSDVIVYLKYHPFYHQNDQAKVLATTTTDSQGRYLFDNVEPGVYTFQTAVPLEGGGRCNDLDLTRVIKIEAGTVATVNFSLACKP